MRFLRRTVVAFALFLVVGNLAILAAFGLARATAAKPELDLEGIGNFRPVDEHLWRGNAPTVEGYRQLAAHGVTRVVDLRAERDVVVDEALLDELGIERVHIPIRDGQVPRPAVVDAALHAITTAPGPVFVHCGAGVGRTGVVVGAYLVREQGWSPMAALRHNLAVGPPSLEQIQYVATLGRDGGPELPNRLLVAVSRLWDAPRRIWANVQH